MRAREFLAAFGFGSLNAAAGEYVEERITPIFDDSGSRMTE
jgi:hypothetical protein